MGKRLLVVDDSRAMREAIRHGLMDAGYEVVEAGSIAEAKALLLEGPWDGLVLDVGLPDGDGRTIAELMPGVPFIDISGTPGTTLAKPFTPDALRQAVARMWEDA